MELQQYMQNVNTLYYKELVLWNTFLSLCILSDYWQISCYIFVFYGSTNFAVYTVNLIVKKDGYFTKIIIRELKSIRFLLVHVFTLHMSQIINKNKKY